MCRNIRPLFNYDPPVTEDEIREAALQYVRKVSGFGRPSKINEQAFSQAVNQIATATSSLLQSLETDSPRRSRSEELVRARVKAIRRFGGDTKRAGS